MKNGGNAIDAAVATGFALAVAYPSAGNIGGGGYAVVYLQDGTVTTLDHRETAPAKASRDMFLNGQGGIIPGMSRQTHAASGVPGSVDGLLTLLERYGTKSRREILAPAIRLAAEGIVLTEDMVRQFNFVTRSMQNHPASLKIFTNNGKPWQIGELWKQPDLARTLSLIAERGRDGFYRGEIAGLIVAEMQRGNGLITLEDLAAYKSVWREPIKGSYRGYDIYGMPPSSSGGVLITMMLNMLEPYDLKSLGWGSSGAVHLLVEAERRAYADRMQHLGDMNYYPVPVARLTSKDYARERFGDFDSRRATSSAKYGTVPAAVESLQTTHFSVMDAAGNAVALTTTLNSSFGNRIVVAGAGFLLNNEMDDFSIKENTANQFGLLGRAANSIEPGKRMLSSMSPTIVVKDGKPFLITGSPGGSTIITTVLQVIVNIIDFGMGIEDAVALPRFHHQWQPDAIMHDPYALSPDTQAKLKAMGHPELRSVPFGRGMGDANSILYQDGVMHGMKDPRNDGAAVGY
jgi:gamma-glutamyltranspeptidase/glutathione hydrolase